MIFKGPFKPNYSVILLYTFEVCETGDLPAEGNVMLENMLYDKALVQSVRELH